MANPKCKQCGKILDRQSLYMYQKTEKSSKLYFCNESEFDMYMKEINRVKLENRAKYKPDKVKSDGTVNPRRLLTDAIKSIYVSSGYDKREIPWKMETAVMKNLMDNYKDYEDKPYNERGIISCLEYMKDIEGMSLFTDSSNTILALVPFSYDKNKRYRYQCIEIKQAVANFEFDDNVIVIKKSKNVGNRWREIDMGDL